MATLARQLMQADPLTVGPDTPLSELLHLVVVARLGCVPVVDEGGAVIGLVSASDLLQAVDQINDEDVDSDDAEAPEDLEHLTARDVATPDIVWVSPEMPVGRVARLMRREAIHRVLVGDGRKVAGILTAFDLLAAIDG